jgi:hypothetical protein
MTVGLCCNIDCDWSVCLLSEEILKVGEVPLFELWIVDLEELGHRFLCSAILADGEGEGLVWDTVGIGLGPVGGRMDFEADIESLSWYKGRAVRREDAAELLKEGYILAEEARRTKQRRRTLGHVPRRWNVWAHAHEATASAAREMRSIVFLDHLGGGDETEGGEALTVK